MSAEEWFRRNYGVEAWVGRKVIADGSPGVIVGYSGPHLLVSIEGEYAASVWHPTWRMEYV